jgi:PAS domain S-box-containing protein
MNRDTESQREKLILDIAAEGFFDWDIIADRAYLNPQYWKLIGYSPDTTVFDTNFLKMIIHPDDHQKVFSPINELLDSQKENVTLTYRVISKDGAIHWVESRFSAVEHDEKGMVSRIIGTIIDITGQKKTEDELHKLNRALLAISKCNQALLHANNEMELLSEICRIVVETGGYRMAWVGYAQHDLAKSVRPVAQAGFEAGYLETLMLSWADTERGRGPTGTAIRTSQPCFALVTDKRYEPWRGEAITRGYAASQSLPLKKDDTAFGALSIYSASPDAFNTEETNLLTSLAENLAYGITMLQTRKAQKLAEDELRQSEARYRSLFQNKHMVMLIIDPIDGAIVDANPAAVRFYGWGLNELCKMKISDINQLPEIDLETEMRRANDKECDRFIFRHRRADGTVRDVDVVSVAIPVHGKSLLYSIISDITDRKQAEEALRYSERKLRTITEQIAETVFVTDTKGVLTYASQAIEKIFGYTSREVIGHFFTEYLVDEEIPGALVIFNKTLQYQLTDQILEFRFLKKNGLSFFGEVHVHYYRDQDSSGMIGLIRDISERKLNESFRKQYEQELLENGQFLKSIYEEVNHSIFVVDVLQDGSYRYKGNNPLHEELTGIRNEEIVGKTPENLFPPNIAETVISNYAACIREGRSIEYEECLPLTGKECWWETVLNPVRDDSGQIYRIIGTSTNITERKLAEEKLLQLNKTLEQRIADRTKELEIMHQQMILQEKLASIGQLAAGIAHELNNPLNYIKINFATQKENFNDLLSLFNEYREITQKTEEKGALSDQELQKLHNLETELNLTTLLDDIVQIFVESQKGFERITTIINSMRSFSNRYAVHEKNSFDINQGIRNTLILTRHEYRDYADIDTKLEELPFILCNHEQINQVFLNLIINSAHAIESQHRSSRGKISIHTWFDNSNVFCSIADDGPGIPNNIRNRIFEPFFSTKEPGKGIGLGLSISYDIIVHKHGGTLSVNCPAEGGTVFLITLPQQSDQAIFDVASENNV